MNTQCFKLVFFCPVEQTDAVLDHLFKRFPIVLGKIGNYEQTAFLTRGTGQFVPVGDARPAIGSVGTLERVDEYRVETIVHDSSEGARALREIIAELKQVHPYEEVAYDVYKLENF